MSGDDGAAMRLDPCVPDSTEEALILWQFCSTLADRIRARHESELIEWLMREERAGRCDEHPWLRHQRCCQLPRKLGSPRTPRLPQRRLQGLS